MNQQRKINKSVMHVALATLGILLIPLVAMQFSDEVKWGVLDFVIAGILLFGTGLSYVVLSRLTSNIINKLAYASAVGTTFLLIYINLAVGLIGGGPNLGNLMYIGVVAVVIVGIILSRFTPVGMERAMYTSAFSLVIVAVIALMANMHEYPESSVIEIIGVNGFFVFLYMISGLLFRYVAQTESSTD